MQHSASHAINFVIRIPNLRRLRKEEKAKENKIYERTPKIRKDIYGLRKQNKAPENYIYVNFATKKKLVGGYLPIEEVIDECSKLFSYSLKEFIMDNKNK